MAKIVLPPYSMDYGDCTPGQTAEVMLGWCRAKAELDIPRLAVLGVMAGAFIALGAVLFTAVMTGVPPWFGPARLIAGFSFAMGLLLVCMTGAELSTGNCMMAAARLRGQVDIPSIVRVLGVTFLANAVGALIVALLMGETGLLDGRHGRLLVEIADAKMALPPGQAFARAILCNALVCLAVWMGLAGRTLPSKLAGLALPIAAFVACGFEHSIANIYFLPAAMLAGSQATLEAAAINIAVVTAGNLAGGLAVALALGLAHLPRYRIVPQVRRGPGFVWRKAA